jgi:hypothetical protein
LDEPGKYFGLICHTWMQSGVSGINPLRTI